MRSAPVTAAFVRSIDWAATPLGPMEAWPKRLLGYVELILELPTPAVLFWGPEQTQIYNEGYSVIMGARHPQYFGARYRDCWPDTAPTILPWMQQVMDEGRPLEVARAPFTLTREGFAEEAYFTFTFSPLRDDEGKIVGIYQPVVEMTDAVLRERRAETLRLLTAPGPDVIAQAMEAFAANPSDVPLAAVYLWEGTRGALRLTHATELAAWDEVTRGAVYESASAVFGTNRLDEVDVRVPTAHWPEPVQKVVVLPVRRSSADPPFGVIAFGVSPRLVFDARYREFLEGVTREIGTNLAARSAEETAEAWREREAAAKAALARRMSMLFEHAPVGIAVLHGPDHIFEVANPQYVSLLRNRPLLHLPLRQALPELAGQGIFELVERVYQTSEPFLGRSIRLFVDQGDGTSEERFFDFAYEPIPGDDGKTASVLVVVFDVSELARARRDAEAASLAKDEFFAILGHELRNPLAPIVTALELMRFRGGDVFVKERALIERQVTQITRLVDDLLDVARITRGKVTLKREPVELAEVVAKGIEMASPLLEQRRHRLGVHVTAGIRVMGDAARLAQVFANLLTNAAKYTEPGGEVQVSAELQASRVSVVIADTGIGIEAEVLPRVFEPFEQARQALDRAQGGLGLGLTIVKNLVTLHGGSVSVSSAGAGQGSVFTVELPLTTETATPASRVTPLTAAPTTQRARRVLVVDDNEDAAELLAEGLEMFGWEARVANDGVAALRLAEDFAPDVGLLDIGLPVMDGYELARQLRSRPSGKRLHLVAITGYGQASDRLRATEAGFDAHLVKPVDLTTVAELLEGIGDDGPLAE